MYVCMYTYVCIYIYIYIYTYIYIYRCMFFVFICQFVFFFSRFPKFRYYDDPTSPPKGPLKKHQLLGLGIRASPRLLNFDEAVGGIG